MRAALSLAFVVGAASSIRAGEPSNDFVAYSLREADRLAARGCVTAELLELGSMTRIIGMVLDAPSRDVILVGRNLAGPPVTLDHLVVTLRSRLLRDEWPALSLDATPDPLLLGVSTVGGIAGTIVQREFLDADVLLKTISLRETAPHQAIPTFRALALARRLEQLRSEGVEPGPARWLERDEMQSRITSFQGRGIAATATAQARFWFSPRRPQRFVTRDGVFAIEELALCVQVELMGSPELPSPDSAEIRFAEATSAALENGLRASTTLGALKPIYDLTAVAEGIRNLPERPELPFLLHDYTVAAVASRDTWGAEEFCAVIARPDGVSELLQITGGVELFADLQWLEAGDFGRLRGIVLSARPSQDTLTWRLPLEGWSMLNGWGVDVPMHAPRSSPAPGFTVSAQTITLAPVGLPPDGLPSFTGLAAQRPLAGVSMRFQVSSRSFLPDDSGVLRGCSSLLQRPERGALWWSVTEAAGR